MNRVYLNGRLVPRNEAQVSVLDRGFLFGDGVYEVIPVYNRQLFHLEQHLLRLQHSLAGIRLVNPHTASAWGEILRQLIADQEWADQSIYLQITRGYAPLREHIFPKSTVPTVFVMANPLTPPSDAELKTGVTAITVRDVRWERCDIKAITLLANALARQEALERDAYEAILIRAGLATEGAASNLFIVRDGVICTPPKGPLLLPGITRDVVLELAAEHHLTTHETDIRVEHLTTAEEIWLTSSTREVLPVTRLDDKPVGSGLPGPIWTQMQRLYQAFKSRFYTGSGPG